MGKLYKITCDPACGFEVQSHNEKEVVRMGMAHVTDSHPEMKVTAADMKKGMKTM